MEHTEPISQYKKPLLKYVFWHRSQLKEQLTANSFLSETVINTLFKQKPKAITESLLAILDKNDIKTLITEAPIKCSIDSVEKRAKRIIFVKYNWDPKNVLFSTEKDVVQITAVDDLRPELQSPADDNVIFKFLKTLSNSYRKDLNKEFTGFCDKLTFMSSHITNISSSVYCYAIIKQADGFYFFSSNGEKKKLKRPDHPQYTINKLYYKIGIFASNVKS